MVSITKRMTSKTFDTIIIGGGISGLACAKRLQEHNEDFLLISKDIGGRILPSEDGTANYGAFFVCLDYYHTLKYVKLKNQIRLRDFCFHEGEDTYVLFEPALIKYSFQFLKALRLLYKFRKAFRKLRKVCENTSQKEAIENDSFLHDVYMKNAADFVKEYAIESGTDRYLSKGLYSTTFSKIDEMNAFSFLEFCLPLITPIYRFSFEKDKMIESFKDKIIIGSVSDIKHKDGKYKIKSGKDFFHSKNIVLATEINWSQRFAGVKKTNLPVDTNMLHIKGNPKSIIAKKEYQLFSYPSNVQAIATLKDETFLFYYKNKQPSLDRYFANPKIISHKHWKPAGTINGHTLIECNRGNNMFLIGDYNVAGLEESYITGIFAANQIVKLNQP
ncbi:MAG: NAD(P)-binding protein [Thermoplasmatales archaeon]|nr:NAD(P)-binding protein [Thermoplasmatales archaeon]